MQSRVDFFPFRVLYPSPSRPLICMARAQKNRVTVGSGYRFALELLPSIPSGTS